VFGLLAVLVTAEQLVPTPGIPSTGFPVLDQYRASRIAMFVDDFGQKSLYRYENQQLPPPEGGRVIFFGDSITQGWRLDKSFPGKPYINRGISGQTTSQMIVRFRQDVVALQPEVVVILGGTNDIAGNTGPVLLEDVASNLESIAELARANGIKVVLSTILPVHNYTAKSQDAYAQRPPWKIVDTNALVKTYCRLKDVVLLDYFAAMVDSKGLLKRELAEDGVHPNDNGYKVMAPLAEAAIAEAKRRQH